MIEISLALVSCAVLGMVSGVVLLLAWPNRDRIEMIEGTPQGFRVRFYKSGRQR